MTDINNHPAYRLESIPEPPVTLSAGAKREWNAIVPVIFELQTARPADLRSLELLVELLADINILQEIVRKDGVLIGTGTDSYKTHPAQKSLEVARRQAQNLLALFGLVPGSSARRISKFEAGPHRSRYG
jgi:P27 family predicted phage terminase small subunit